MADILQNFPIQAPPSRVFAAVSAPAAARPVVDHPIDR